MRNHVIALAALAAVASGCSALNTIKRADDAMTVVEAVEQVALHQYGGLKSSQICLPEGSQRQRAVVIVSLMGWQAQEAKPGEPCQKLIWKEK